MAAIINKIRILCRSRMDLPIKWHITQQEFDKIFFKKKPWACFWCNFLISFACAFDRFNATAGRTVMQILKFFGHFFHLDGNKNWLCPWSNTRIAPLQWEFNKDLEKLPSSHPKDVVIRNQSAKIFIDQCDFIGRMEAWPNFRKLQDSSTQTDKIRFLR